MKTLPLTKILTCAILPLAFIGNLEAADTLSIHEVGHISHQVDNKFSTKLPIATTVISRSSDGNTQVTVSQSFDNSADTTIHGEYFFPMPEAAQLLNFISSNDYELEDAVPQKSVQIAKGDQLSISYQYLMATRDNYQASVMGFPVTSPMTSDTVTSNLSIASK